MAYASFEALQVAISEFFSRAIPKKVCTLNNVSLYIRLRKLYLKPWASTASKSAAQSAEDQTRESSACRDQQGRLLALTQHQ